MIFLTDSGMTLLATTSEGCPHRVKGIPLLQDKVHHSKGPQRFGRSSKAFRLRQIFSS
jgi:hypothetical protein